MAVKNFSRRMTQIRLQDSGTQKLGHIYVHEGLEELFRCCCLELPWRGNKRNISAYPPGRYLVKKRWSVRHRWHFHVQNVEGRSFILIHRGNFFFQVEGCTVVGNSFRDINGDGHLDVINSGTTLNMLLDIMPNKFWLDVISTAPVGNKG